MSNSSSPRADSRARNNSDTGTAKLNSSEVSFFEFWPLWAMYLPVVFEWIIQSIRYRSLMLPFLANPSLTLAGMVGMSKSELMIRAQGRARDSILAWVLYRVTGESAEAQAMVCINQCAANGIALPFVCKPNLGCRGAGVKLVQTESQLADIIGLYPPGAELICQQLSEHEPEVGIFFVRDPETGITSIPSMTQKILPRVTGDGLSSLGELIEQDPRASKLSFLYRERFTQSWSRVPAKGESVRLVFSASHSKGAIFIDARHEVTEALKDAVDEIAEGLPDFYYGRMDVKYPDMDSLKAGLGLQVIEVNGASAESIHIWDKNTKFFDALGTLRWQYRTLFRIGAFHRRSGKRVPSMGEFIECWKRDRALTKFFPFTD